MSGKGLFSSLLTRAAWFSESLLRKGWFDRTLIEPAAPPSGGGGGSISFVGGFSQAFTGTTSNTTVSLTGLTGGSGSAPIAGDLVIVTFNVCNAGSNPPLSIITSGYTVATDTWQNGALKDDSLLVAYKLMTSTPDTDVIVSGTNSTGNPGVVLVQVWRGVDSTTPMDVTPVLATGFFSSALDPGAITPVTAGAKIIVAGSAATTNTGTTLTATGLSNTVSNQFVASNTVAAAMGAIDWTSGAYDPAAWSGGGSVVGETWLALTMALRPGAGGASTGNFLIFF